MRVLHVAPHPGDELIGIGGTLLALHDAGHEILNFPVFLGDERQQPRAQQESRDGANRAGFKLFLPEKPYTQAAAALDQRERDKTQESLVMELTSLIEGNQVDLLVGPSPHDRHPDNELVGRALHVAAGLAGIDRLWLWSTWGELPMPTVISPLTDDIIDRVLWSLAAYQDEIDRNDYRKLVRGRAQAAAVLGPERVFGFGTRGGQYKNAELFTELVHTNSLWLLGRPHALHTSVQDDDTDLLRTPGDMDVTWWLRSMSMSDRLARHIVPTPQQQN